MALRRLAWKCSHSSVTTVTSASAWSRSPVTTLAGPDSHPPAAIPGPAPPPPPPPPPREHAQVPGAACHVGDTGRGRQHSTPPAALRTGRQASRARLTCAPGARARRGRAWTGKASADLARDDGCGAAVGVPPARRSDGSRDRQRTKQRCRAPRRAGQPSTLRPACTVGVRMVAPTLRVRACEHADGVDSLWRIGTCAVEPRVAGHLRVMLLAQMFNNAQRRRLGCCCRHVAWRRLTQAPPVNPSSASVPSRLLLAAAQSRDRSCKVFVFLKKRALFFLKAGEGVWKARREGAGGLAWSRHGRRARRWATMMTCAGSRRRCTTTRGIMIRGREGACLTTSWGGRRTLRFGSTRSRRIASRSAGRCRSRSGRCFS